MAVKTGLPGVFLFLLVGLCGCARRAQDESFKAFQGTWDVVSLDKGGTKFEAARLKPTVVFEKDRFQMRVGDGILEDFVIRVDASKTSGEIEFVYLTGADQGRSELGIFELEEKTLKLCKAEVGKSRPAELAAKKGMSWTFIVLRRQE